MRTLVLSGLLVLACAGAASAQQPTPEQGNAIKQACRADYQSHCASVPTGGAAALQCLQQNAGSVSAPCQQALSAVSGGGAGAAATPSPATPPPATPPSGAPPPQAAAPPPAPPLSPREEVAILRVSCGHDYRLLCHGVPLGGGRAIDCLREHASRLSRQCRSALLQARQLQ